MAVTPVISYPCPDYPPRTQVLADPALLQRHLPPAWRHLAGVGGLVAFFLGAEALAVEPPPAAGPASAATMVAPLFRHGQGRGAFGCVAVSPPVFLSEEEAMTVIAEELGRSGVVLSQRAVVWDDVAIPRRETVHTIPRGTPADQERVKAVVTSEPVDPQPPSIDAVDPARHIAVEFVSRDDHHQLGLDSSRGRIVREDDANLPEGTYRSGMFASSAGSYDLAEAADYLRGQVPHHQDGGRTTWMGVFYDPMERSGARGAPPADLDEAGRLAWRTEDWQRRQAEAKAAALTRLRAQVQGFVAWLQAQGAL